MREVQTVLFECVNPRVAKDFCHELSAMSTGMFDVCIPTDQTVEAEWDEQFVRAFIFGEPKSIYWSGFTMAEARLHQVAFIGNRDYREGEAFEIKDLLPYGMIERTAEERAVKEWLAEHFYNVLDAYSFSPEEMGRIVSMCHLGRDDSIEAYALNALFKSGERYTKSLESWKYNYALDMDTIQAKSRANGDHPQGDRLLQRVMFHFIYLSNKFPVEGPPRVQQSGSGVQRMNLG